MRNHGIKNCPEFDEWVNGIREAYRNLIVNNILFQLKNSYDSIDNTTFEKICKRIIDIDICNEKAYRYLINLKIENGGVFLVSNPLFGFDVKRFFNPEMKLKKLSRSAMETLAIIAYKGPVTKAEIEQIRGAGADKTMANLLERKLIYISGKKKSIGTPNLYEVTEDFYSYLNIHGREELPGSEQFQKIDLLYREDEKMKTESSDNENV